MTKQDTVGIAAIFKNEAPYILEWVAFHRAVGISKFFIADNNIDDGTTEILEDLQAAGFVNMFSFPGKPGTGPQLPAYSEIIARFSNQVDWMAFIDADEFLLPSEDRTVPEIVTEIGVSPNIGAIAVNWAIFGSSGHIAYSNNPVISRFGWRAAQNWQTNCHYKSVVRTSALRSVGHNPHAFVLGDETRFVHVNGEEVADHAHGAGLSAKVIWGGLRLNHYVVKSRSEFLFKKRARGRATTKEDIRPEAFFDSHDKNDVLDPVGGKWLIRTQEIYDQMTDLVGTPAERSAFSFTPYTDEHMIDLRNLHETTKIRSAIDSITVEGSVLAIRGWAVTGSGEPVEGFVLKVGERTIDCSVSPQTRRDVAKALVGSSPECGFMARVSLLDQAFLEEQGAQFELLRKSDGKRICKSFLPQRKFEPD